MMVHQGHRVTRSQIWIMIKPLQTTSSEVDNRPLLVNYHQLHVLAHVVYGLDLIKVVVKQNKLHHQCPAILGIRVRLLWCQSTNERPSDLIWLFAHHNSWAISIGDVDTLRSPTTYLIDRLWWSQLNQRKDISNISTEISFHATFIDIINSEFDEVIDDMHCLVMLRWPKSDLVGGS